MASIDANGRQEASDFNLEPDPRVLPMLGEINIDQWRCVAELVDNAGLRFPPGRLSRF